MADEPHTLSSPTENGFQEMSRRADESAPSSKNEGEGETDDLTTHGVDTNQLIEAVQQTTNDLFQMVIDEVRARPIKALGWAAAAGLFLGFISAR